MVAFTFLNAIIVATPLLKQFDLYQMHVIVVCAVKWEVSAALPQKHKVAYWPVTFYSLKLNSIEVNYGMAEKELI